MKHSFKNSNKEPYIKEHGDRWRGKETVDILLAWTGMAASLLGMNFILKVKQFVLKSRSEWEAAKKAGCEKKDLCCS